MPLAEIGNAADFVPASRSLAALREAAAACRGCELHAAATRTVFGGGRAGAPLMLVGEQPGDKEDIAGHPFVGPAGRLLDRALRDAGVARERAYVTNAVMHFKFVEPGKRRVHAKPKTIEIRACEHGSGAPLVDPAARKMTKRAIAKCGNLSPICVLPVLRCARKLRFRPASRMQCVTSE